MPNNLKLQTEKILIKERGYISREPYNEDVVVTASGGLDSSICIPMLIEKYNCKVFPLFIRRHSKAMKFEENSFDKIIKYLLKKYPDNMKPAKKIEIEIPPLELKKGLKQERLETLGHALRNVALQTVAVQYAVQMNDTENTNIKSIFAGSIGDDSFPHNFIEAFRIFTLQVCWDLKDREWQVTSPFQDEFITKIPKMKKDAISWALENKFPLEKTRTCTLGDEISCGVCGDCLKRKKAFKEAGSEDKIKYKN